MTYCKIDYSVLSTPTIKKVPLVVFTIFLAVHMACLVTSAQDEIEKLPEGVVPPSLSFLTDDEATTLEKEKRIKSRVKLGLLMMGKELGSAESLVSNEKFQKTLDKLAKFNAYQRSTLAFLIRNEARRSSIKGFKRFEIGLRGFLPRLYLIRREMTFEYGYHVDKLVEKVIADRERSIEPLFGDNVVSNSNK